MTPGLPWPWRACKGGRIRDANGEVVTQCADRRAAKALLRDVEPLLRALVAPAASSTAPAPARPRLTGRDESLTITVNGRAYTYSTADVTSAELADRINATHPGGIVASSTGVGGRITIISTY